jgi:hypothetical protein
VDHAVDAEAASVAAALKVAGELHGPTGAGG